MNKMIMTALCALMMVNSAYANKFTQSKSFSESSFAEAMGNDKGNGGDAILLNDEMVMRDFVARSNIEPVEDTIKFLQAVSGLKEILMELSQVNGHLAFNILRDLTSVSFSVAENDLEVLAPGQTGIGGPKAQVQLAIRWNSDIVLSPRFFSSEFKSQRPYLMIHEALHGVLEDSEGPLHHTRVRTIVNYLKTQRGHYDSEKLRVLLQGKAYSGESKLTAVFDKNTPSEVRCWVSDYNQGVAQFLGFACSENGFESRKAYFCNRLNVKCKDWAVLESDLSSAESSFYEHISPVNLGKKGSIFDPKLRNAQFASCSERNFKAGSLERHIKELEVGVNFANKVDAFLARKDVSAAEKKMLEAELENYSNKDLSRRLKTVREKYADSLVSRKNAKENARICTEMWGEGFSYP